MVNCLAMLRVLLKLARVWKISLEFQYWTISKGFVTGKERKVQTKASVDETKMIKS